MTKTRLIAAAALTAAALLGGAADAQSPVIVKIATIAPDGSPWHDLLLELAQRWRDLSNGAVQVKIYAGGSQGDEAELVRKVRIGLLQGVAVTSSGLDTISPGFSAFSVPLLIESYEELDYVRDRISPRLTQSLVDHGFVVLNWGDGGWVRFFTTHPVRPSTMCDGCGLLRGRGIHRGRSSGSRPDSIRSRWRRPTSSPACRRA